MTRFLAAVAILAVGTLRVDGGFVPPLQPQHPIGGANPAQADVCTAWTMVEQISRQTSTRIGFENLPECMLAPSQRDAGERVLQLRGATAAAALDAVVQMRPDFSWRAIGDTLVVRPVAAWDDRGDALNRLVQPFAERDVHPHDLLHRLLGATHPSLLAPHTDLQPSSAPAHRDDPTAAAAIDALASVDFAGGTLVEALTAVEKASRANWQVGFVDGRMKIALHSTMFDGGNTTIVTAPTRGSSNPMD